MVKKQGLYVITENGRNVLMYNGKRISTKLIGRVPSFGVYIGNKRLDVSGGTVANATSNSPHLKDVNGDLYLDDLLLTDSGVCINITRADYNRLLAGEAVEGMKTYDSSSVYNIVANPLTAETITYTLSGDTMIFSSGVQCKKGIGIYNSVSGELTENTEDLAATISNTACPRVHVRYFNPTINVNDAIELKYFVDTQVMSSLLDNEISDTFTLVVVTPYGTVKKTTYAGEHSITLPSFTEAGIKWFSVRCIDSNGVGSVEQFFDVLVKTPHEEQVYTMTEADLEFEYDDVQYSLVPNNTTPSIALANKAAFTALFKKVKESGYDRIVMYNNHGDNNGKGTTYWIDYHKDFNGTQTYYLATVEDGKIVSVSEPIPEEDVPNVSDGVWTEYVNFTNSINEVIGSSEDIDSGQLYIVRNTSKGGNHIEFPDYFTVDLNECTIAATQSNDLDESRLICLNRNTDTHIVNGTVVGNLNGFDYDLTRKRVGHTPEKLNVLKMVACKYCSFENLDASYAVGGLVNFEEIGTNVGEALAYRSPSYPGTGLYVGSIDLSDGSETSTQGMVRTGQFNVNSGEIICLGSNGYATYLYQGREREIFFCFYDEEQSYIGFVKSHLYNLVRVPDGAKYCKIVGYGEISSGDSDTNQAHWKPANKYGFIMIMWPSLNRNITVKNCYLHDTFAVAIGNTCAKGVLFENCTFERATLGFLSGTMKGFCNLPLLADNEDQSVFTSNVYWVNNKRIGEKTRDGYSTVLYYYCKSFEFVGNDGFNLYDLGGISEGIIEGNTNFSVQIDRNRSCYFPTVIYRNNKLSSLTMNYGKYRATTTDWSTAPHTAITGLYVGDSELNYTCAYSGLKLRNTKNGIEIVD